MLVVFVLASITLLYWIGSLYSVGGFGWLWYRLFSVISSGSFGLVLFAQCCMNGIAVGWMYSVPVSQWFPPEMWRASCWVIVLNMSGLLNISASASIQSVGCCVCCRCCRIIVGFCEQPCVQSVAGGSG